MEEPMIENSDAPYCSKAWFQKNLTKIVLVAFLAAMISYVVLDIVTKKCTEVENEDDRFARILCDPVTGPEVLNATGQGSTLFLCQTPSDTSWALDPPVDPRRCIRRSACITTGVQSFLDWIGKNTVTGVFVFMMTYVAATVCFIPGLLLTLGAGATFAAALGLGLGVLVATISVWVGANIGAIISFLLGRHLLRDFVARMVRKFRILMAIDRAIDQKGFLTVLLLRFSPVIPFNVFNYAMGATGVSLKNYIFGSCLGMLPGTIGYVFIGAAIGTAAKGSGGSRNPSDVCSPADNTIQTVLLIVGMIMTVAAVALISWYAKRNLSAIMMNEKDNEDVIDVRSSEHSNTAGDDAMDTRPSLSPIAVSE